MMVRGTALPSVLFALAISSALVIGGAYVSQRAVSNARAVVVVDRVGEVADSAIVVALTAWDSATMANLPVGLVVSGSSDSGVLRTGTWVTRLTRSVYWVVGEACRLESPRVCRRQGLLIRTVNDIRAITYGPVWSDLP